MMWDEWYDFEHKEEFEEDSHFNFDFFSVLSKPKDYYKILEVDYDASDEAIRSNYIRLALKWHPDKQKSEEATTSRFQEINEAYQVLSDHVKRQEYDKKGMLYTYDSNISDYLNRYKSLILTCNGLGFFFQNCKHQVGSECSLFATSVDTVYECVETQEGIMGHVSVVHPFITNSWGIASGILLPLGSQEHAFCPIYYIPLDGMDYGSLDLGQGDASDLCYLKLQ